MFKVINAWVIYLSKLCYNSFKRITRRTDVSILNYFEFEYEPGEAQVGGNSKGCRVDYLDQVMDKLFTPYRRGVP